MDELVRQLIRRKHAIDEKLMAYREHVAPISDNYSNALKEHIKPHEDEIAEIDNAIKELMQDKATDRRMRQFLQNISYLEQELAEALKTVEKIKLDIRTQEGYIRKRIEEYREVNHRR